MIKNDLLLVDDDEKLLEVYKKIFELSGFSILAANSSDMALKLIREHSISVVIADIIMPKMNGMELLNAIKKDWPDIEVIMLTAEGSISGAVEAVKEGAYTYLIKPADIEELISEVKKAQELFDVKKENSKLKQRIEYFQPSRSFIGESAVASELKRKAKLIGNSDSAVLITGESGTGKEVLAHLIHDNSNRKDMPFVSVNCAALNENLIESEIFGSERGAYTGAEKRRKGRFEIADGGTIFFDEIGELSINMQVKLLRVLQEKTFERVGGTETIASDFRLITATNRDLKKAVEAGPFRLDLYYRINIIPVVIPPLRDRSEDIPMLCDQFLKDYSAETNKRIEPLDKKIMDILKKYSWPGNVRELRNIVERLVVMNTSGVIAMDDLPLELTVDIGDIGVDTDENLKHATKEFEKDYITEIMRRNGWNVTKAAAEMGIARKNLYKKLNDYGIKFR